MNRERPPPDPERQFATNIASRGHFLTRIDRKGHDFRGVAPYHPFSPSTAARDWERCCKGSRHKRLGFCLGVDKYRAKCATNPPLSLGNICRMTFPSREGQFGTHFKPSKSMPVSRMECQMEWLSIGDVTVAVAASLGDNCLLSSTMRAKAASGPPHCCKVWYRPDSCRNRRQGTRSLILAGSILISP